MYSLGCKLITVGWVHFRLAKDTHFVWLDALTKPVNNPKNSLLINPIIISYYF